jgi:hypothetical protein
METIMNKRNGMTENKERIGTKRKEYVRRIPHALRDNAVRDIGASR